MSIEQSFPAFALGIVTPWGQDPRSGAWLQEPRGRAAGAHGRPRNIARPHIYVRERPPPVAQTDRKMYIGNVIREKYGVRRKHITDIP